MTRNEVQRSATPPGVPSYLTTKDVAAIFDCSLVHVQKLARTCRVGFNIGGRSGYRFTEADVDAMRRSMQPVEIPVQRRRTRRSA